MQKLLMPQQRKSICILAISTVARDARVLRQIEYLSPHYDITVIGEGKPPPAWDNIESIRWYPIPVTFRLPRKSLQSLIQKSTTLALHLSGSVFPSNYSRLYWRTPVFKDTLALAVGSACNAFHANDWNTLPIAAEAAKRLGAKLVFDAHEYSPLQHSNRLSHRLLNSPMIRHILHRYAGKADATVTVAPALAEKYSHEFPMNPIVVMNAPDVVALLERKKVDPSDIRLIHHGVAAPDRHLETMIKALALCDKRYSLHFMLVGSNTSYIDYLKKLAHELTLGRVTFHAPVAPENIVQQIAQYDIGFYVLSPVTYNMFAALPNKFFDFIAAGLAVCIGPSPSMVEIVDKYKFGCVAPSFKPQDVAATLNQLSTEQIAQMKEAAREATKELNAEREMNKLVDIYKRLLPR